MNPTVGSQPRKDLAFLVPVCSKLMSNSLPPATHDHALDRIGNNVTKEYLNASVLQIPMKETLLYSVPLRGHSHLGLLSQSEAPSQNTRM